MGKWICVLWKVASCGLKRSRAKMSSYVDFSFKIYNQVLFVTFDGKMNVLGDYLRTTS